MKNLSVKDLSRIRKIVSVLVRHGFGQRLSSSPLNRFLPDRLDSVNHSLHWTERVRQAINDLGPTFVKLGQVLSVRPDLVPPVLAKELEKLQDRVDPVSFETIAKVLEEELQSTIPEVFRDFHEEPLASASIAQVHRASLRDGTAVAVKIQRPGIEPIIRSDIRILYTLARLVEGSLDLPGAYSAVDIVAEFETALHQEMDFLTEARNCDRFRTSLENSHPGIVVPRTFPKQSSRRVLTLELIDGEPVSTLVADDPRARTFSRTLMECTFTQVFENGFFHGDPHPGNIFLLEDGRTAYLDFGLMGTLSGEMQQMLAAIFTALVFRDAEGLTLAVYQAGGTAGRVDLKAFRKEVAFLMEKYHGAALKDFADRSNLLEIIQVAANHNIVLPREYVFLARTAALTYGQAQRLVPDIDIVEELKPLAQRLLTSRLDPGKVLGDTARMLLHARMSLSQLPLQANQFLSDLEAGRLQITVHDPETEKLRLEVRTGAYRLSVALCAVGMALSGSLMIASMDVRILGFPLIPLLGCLTLLSGVLGWVSLVAHIHLADHLSPRLIPRTLFSLFKYMFRRSGK